MPEPASRRNEVILGATIVAAVLIGFFGMRFFEGRPLFGGGYELVGIFPDAQGISSGSTVRVSGIRVGNVERIRLSPTADEVHVTMSINPGVTIPRGGQLATSGFAALGDVSVAIRPGPPGNPPYQQGDTLRAQRGADLFAELQEGSVDLLGQANEVLGQMSAAGQLVNDPQGDLRQTLASLRSSTVAVDQLLRQERQRLTSTLANLEVASAGAARLSGDLQAFADVHADSLALLVSNANRAVARVDAAITQLGTTNQHLDEVLFKLNTGQGTLGRLLNEPEVYERLESTLTTLDEILEDFQTDPARYLRELRLFSVF